MFWLGLACKPWLWLGFVRLWLEILQAKAKAMDGGLAWLGFGLSHGFNQKLSMPKKHEKNGPKSTHIADKTSRLMNFEISGSLGAPLLIIFIHRLKPRLPGLALACKSQAKAKANLKPKIWLGLAWSSHGFGFLACWLQAKPRASLDTHDRRYCPCQDFIRALHLLEHDTERVEGNKKQMLPEEIIARC
ncbi:hypothetical protein DFH06DRAFT_1440118 [Mycena polygramma]|nr:hypothetical protein DFH06DRAFT_1440118 [Mycena polygramma]